MKCFYLSLALLCSVQVYSQVRGCTDPQATNYRSDAEINDGSCTYKSTFYSPEKLCPKLSDTLQETSGLCYYNGLFWSHNDSDNPPEFYAFDSLDGRILHKVLVSNASNTDWEDMTQDKDHFYLGDFGNNGGTRKDLRILKIKKSDIHLNRFADTVQAEFIRFSMSDQTDFSERYISNDYDMEAFFFLNDSLHLFSKNWVDAKTRHYICPIDTGTYALSPAETLQVGGQISGACINSRGVVMLVGYTKPLYPCFVWIFWDYSGNRFNNGNRRKVDMGNTLYPGQTEGICLLNNTAYISNEYKIIQPQLLKMNIERWIDTLNNNSIADTFTERSRVNYADQQLKIWSKDLRNGLNIDLYDNSGKKVATFPVKIDASGNCEPIPLQLPAGMYFVKCQRVVLGKILVQL